MKYALIGGHLSHSFSPRVHSLLGDYEYCLCELECEEFDAFMRAKDFAGINVTIPYKREVIPYLDYIDPLAREIGAVNTVVNRGGKLYGYNTDFIGFRKTLLKLCPDVSGKKALVLGTGGAAGTAYRVLCNMGADVRYVSRNPRGDMLGYDEAQKCADVELLVNATPCGMYPNNPNSPIDLSGLCNLKYLIDLIYNPLCTTLAIDACSRGVKTACGLYMLVCQAVGAYELFFDKKAPEGTEESVYNKLLREKENIVLIGMPSSGKSTVGAALAERLGRDFLDTDSLFTEKTGLAPDEYIRANGEESFRDIESEIIKAVSVRQCSVISCGGGSVLREDNVASLRQNGRIYYLDRPLDALAATPDRPLSDSAEKLEKLYLQRKDIYESVCDVRVGNSLSLDGMVDFIASEIKG